MKNPKRYLIMSADGIHAGPTVAGNFLAAMIQPASLSALNVELTTSVRGSIAQPRTAVSRRASAKSAVADSLQVIASIAEDGVKLVSGSEETIAALRQKHPGLRVVEETFCQPALAPRPVVLQKSHSPARRPARVRAAAKPAAAGLGVGNTAWNVTVVRADTNAPVRGAKVVAFTDFGGRIGSEAITAANGVAALTIAGKVKTLERLYVFYDKPGLWGHFAATVPVKNAGLNVALAPVDLSQVDSLKHFHAQALINDGSGVRVGVIDSGVALDHADLVVAGGKNCLPEPEDPANFGPAGDEHGTHVAGIIAGRGTVPAGMRGLAPAAEIRSYRVFGKKSEGSGSSFAVIAAINQAILDGCDLINLSLAFPPGVNDLAVAAALRRARDNGCLPVAAAGNDGRQPVSFPAASTHALAISAAGRVGTFPAHSSETADITSPKGTDPADFLGAFSNNGMELDFTGAGVGVVSTVPGGYAPLSGTSMACPAITGVIARLLAARADIRTMPRSSARTDAIRQLAVSAAKPLGFGNLFEGNGLIP